MNAQFRLSIFLVAIFTMLSNMACTKSSSSDDSGGGGAAVSSTLALAGTTVAAGGTINLIPTGGTPPYKFSLQSSIGGSLSSYSTYTTLVAGNSAGTMTVTVTDAANAQAIANITVTGTSAGTLTVSPLTTTIAPGGTVSYIVSGGTGTYTYSATAGTFSGATYTAPGTAQLVTVTISDGGGHTANATVNVQGTAVSSGNCSGTYTINVGITYTMSITQGTGTAFSGYITDGVGYAAIAGSCTSAGVISFNNYTSGSAYTGTFFVNPNNNKTVMTGTYTYASATYGWYAVQQ